MCSIKEDCTQVHKNPLRIGVLPKFEGLKDEKVFFPKAKINP